MSQPFKLLLYSFDAVTTKNVNEISKSVIDCLKNTTKEPFHRCCQTYAIVRLVLLFKPPSDSILVDGICLPSTRCKMAVNQHCALFFLTFLVPESCLLGCGLSLCILMVLVPLRSLWCQYYRVPMRCKFTVAIV